MKQLDEIIYDALCADADLMETVGQRIKSTCFEVSPEEIDNTPLPCIIVSDDGWQNVITTKDCTWESKEDNVTASIEVDGVSPKEVKAILKRCRTAVANYIHGMAEAGENIPDLVNVQASELAWDWTKPCYHQNLIYQCNIYND